MTFECNAAASLAVKVFVQLLQWSL